MSRRFRVLVVISVLFPVIALAPGALNAQLVVVSGAIYVYNPGGTEPAPAVGHRVYLFNRSTGWIGPSVTDNYGRFAFYKVTQSSYLLTIYYRNPGIPPFEKPITVPPEIVETIVLPHE